MIYLAHTNFCLTRISQISQRTHRKLAFSIRMAHSTFNIQRSTLIFNFQFIIALLSATMFSSCVNDLPYNAEIGAPKLVLNALLLPDSLLTATISRTAHFLDVDPPQRLSDATVTAVINGESHTLTYAADTKDYRTNYILCSGDEVTLTATHPIGTATATQQVMQHTPIHIAQTTMQPFVNPGDPVSLATLNEVDSAMLVSLHIDDPSDKPNYYRLTIDYYGTYTARYPDDIYTYYPATEQESKDTTSGYFVTEEGFYPHYLLTESSSRLVIDSESAAQLLGGLLYLTSYNSIIFSDEHLRSVNGQPTIDFLMLMESPRANDDMYNPDSWWGDNGWGNDFIFPSDTVSHITYHYHFVLENLSEDYYRYLNTLSSYDIMGGTFVGEPTPIHTNIHGGLGIVGSYSATTCSEEKEYDLP